MAKLSDQQLMRILHQAGFRGEALINAFAVAKAESGGNPRAHNPNAGTGDNSYGLFQINMLGSMGPARRKQFGLKSNEDLYDPATNARIAFEMSQQGTNWTPWSVHPDSRSRGGSGSGYERHLSTGRQVASTLSFADAPGIEVAAEDGIQPAPEPTSTQSAQLGISLPQVPDAIAQLPDEELRDYLRKNYGYLAWALDIPEVGGILLRVARGEVTDPDRMFGELFATEWWQQTDDARRQWDALIGQDPAAAQQQVSQVLGDLRAYVARLGLKVPDAALVNIAQDSLRFGWIQAGQNPAGSTQLRNALFAEAKRDGYTPEELARGGDQSALLRGEDAVRDRVKQMFTNRGLPDQEGQVDRIVEEVTSGQRTLQDVRESLDRFTGFDLDAGTLQFDSDRARSLASDYFVPLSEAESERWAARIARGEATEEGLQSYLQEQSASMFSGNRSIGNALERGMTVRQWADPYVQLAARTLELNPNEVDLTDQRFMRGIHNVDPETGEGTAMALGEWQRYLRSLPEWNQTQNATDEVSSRAEFLMSRMGIV